MKRKGDGLDYLKQYPKLNKWMNTCICCGGVGYKPELPDVLTTNGLQEEIETAGARNIRRFFQPLPVNDLGICEDCQKIMGN